MCIFCELEGKVEEIGKYFGYPDCCIQWQKSQVENNSFELNETQHKINQGFGFMPCPECAEKVLKNETTIQGLIKNRICKTPYPFEDDPKELIKYLKNE